MAGLDLKPGWWEDIKDDPMELNIVYKDSEREQRESDRELDLINLTDVELDSKIERLKGLMKYDLPDKGHKLRLNIQKHLDEINRRKALPKSSFERKSPVRSERRENSDNIVSSCSSVSTTEYRWGSPVCSRSAVQQRELKPDGNKADKTANAFDVDLRLVSRRQKKSTENGMQYSNNRPINSNRRSPRMFSCSPMNRVDEGDFTKSLTRNKKPVSSGVSLILGEENGCIISSGKRAASSFTPQSLSKKRSSLTPKCSTEK
ncbi:hypothetical protein KI387_001723, partial [Taxus chinensis]